MVTQEKELNKEAGKAEDEFTVSGDGKWEKRGFSSLFGVTTLIAKYTGKVVDACVLSSFCRNVLRGKIKRRMIHKDIKIDAIVKIFSRSIDKHSVQYLKYIGDGDSGTFKGILNAQP